MNEILKTINNALQSFVNAFSFSGIIASVKQAGQEVLSAFTLKRILIALGVTIVALPFLLLFAWALRLFHLTARLVLAHPVYSLIVAIGIYIFRHYIGTALHLLNNL